MFFKTIITRRQNQNDKDFCFVLLSLWDTKVSSRNNQRNGFPLAEQNSIVIYTDCLKQMNCQKLARDDENENKLLFVAATRKAKGQSPLISIFILTFEFDKKKHVFLI